MLQYVSDLHLEMGIRRKLVAKKPYLILGGDIGCPSEQSYKDFLLECSSNFDKVFVQSGNHEYDKFKNVDEVDSRIINICMMRPNIFFLQKFEYPLCEKDSLYLAGCTLWSTFPKSKTSFHLNHVDWIRETLEKNPDKHYIISTHHCPAYECINPFFLKKGTVNYFVSDQSNLIGKKNMESWIYGHSHFNKDFQMFGKWIVTNQYGARENPLLGFK